jgi:hypothetical protein
MPPFKYDDDFRRLGFVGHQTIQLSVAPAGNVYHRPGRRARNSDQSPSLFKVILTHPRVLAAGCLRVHLA